MIEVYPNLFIGSGEDLPLVMEDKPLDQPTGEVWVSTVKSGWFVVSAAKFPWHRDALGYTGNGAPKTHPEYLVADRERRLILNLIDANDPAYVPEKIINTAIEAIDLALDAKTKVLIHCNQGQSRAPTLALLWLRWGKASVVSYFLGRMSYDDAAAAFREIYPPFAPAGGMEGYARAHWEAK